MLCFFLINSILLNLLCVWILIDSCSTNIGAPSKPLLNNSELILTRPSPWRIKSAACFPSLSRILLLLLLLLDRCYTESPVCKMNAAVFSGSSLLLLLELKRLAPIPPYLSKSSSARLAAALINIAQALIPATQS